MRTRLAAVTAIIGAVGTAAGACMADDFELSQAIKNAKANETLVIPVGIQTRPVHIDRPVTLKGEDVDTCILEITADEPALLVTAKMPVVIEGVTIKWQLASSDGGASAASAVWTKDAPVTLRNCHFIAPASGKRCPSAVACTGFSHVTIENCRFEGFEFTVSVGGGGQAVVSDCILLNPGHCGLTVSSDSQLEVARTIVAGSAFHGLRCTGGTLNAHDNLIIDNKNRGVYLGNKDAHGRLHNNVIIGNATGISGFGGSDATIENNLFLNSTYAGLDARDTCRLAVSGNIFQGNVRGFVQYQDSGRSGLKLGGNTFWKNDTDVEGLDAPPGSFFADPAFTSIDAGEFLTQNQELQIAKQGLADAAILTPLWEKWQHVKSR